MAFPRTRIWVLSLSLVTGCLGLNPPGAAEADFFVQTSPALTWTDAAPLAGLSQLSPEDYGRYYAMPSPLVFGLELRNGGLDLVFRVDTRYEFVSFQTKTHDTNLPFIQNGASALEDANMPTVGFLSWDKGPMRISAGRRALSWGPATWDLAISDSSDYLDHLWFEYHFPAKTGDWWFNYVLIGSDRAGENSSDDANAASQVVVAHRLGWENDNLRFALGELNLIYGIVPDLEDLAPLLAFHNLYQNSYSNVLMTLTGEGRRGKARAYGELVVDDFVMPWESPTGRPDALGWNWGLEWQALGGAAFPGLRLKDGDYALHEASFRESGGLILTYEHYRTTTYIYNRDVDAGKWVFSDHRVVDTSRGYLDSPYAFYLGFPYGPDCSFDSIKASWETDRLKLCLSLGYLQRGAYGIADAYTPGSNDLNWYNLVEPVKRTFILGLSTAWLAERNVQIEASGDFAFGDEAKIDLNLVCSLRWDSGKAFRP